MQKRAYSGLFIVNLGTNEYIFVKKYAYKILQIANKNKFFLRIRIFYSNFAA